MIEGYAINFYGLSRDEFESLIYYSKFIKKYVSEKTKIYDDRIETIFVRMTVDEIYELSDLFKDTDIAIAGIILDDDKNIKEPAAEEQFVAEFRNGDIVYAASAV